MSGKSVIFTDVERGIAYLLGLLFGRFEVVFAVCCPVVSLLRVFYGV